MSLTGRTAVAIGWVAGARAAQQVLQLALSLFLMRLLGPEAFGLIAMVLVFTGFAGMFSEIGFGSALIQRQQVTEVHYSSAFWVTLLLGAGLTLLMIAAAPAVASFYRDPRLAPLTAFIALSFVLGSPATVPRALLQRDLQFKRL